MPQPWRMMMKRRKRGQSHLHLEDHIDSPHTDLNPLRVLFLGFALLLLGSFGFYYLPGMIAPDATGSKWVNSFYCATMTLTTVGYGDICPSDKIEGAGRTFIVALSLAGLGMFCGPIMDLASSFWKNQVPGGLVGLGITTLALGIGIFTTLEPMTELEAAYFTVITGTTIGYGDLRPSTDSGKLAAALFAILSINVTGAFLEPAKTFLIQICQKTESNYEMEDNSKGQEQVASQTIQMTEINKSKKKDE